MATYGEGHEAQPWVQPEADPNAPADDGPSSHETAGQFPADELGHAPEWSDGPSSHETAGQFPADELVNEPAPAPEPEPEPPPSP